MKTKWKAIAVTVGLFTIGSWTLPQENHITKAQWLIGTWENKTPRGNMYESWKKVSDTEFRGKSYILKDKDTVVFETLQLLQTADNLYYIPTVGNQNGGQPVRFALKLATEKSMVFENLQHDFPQIICYTLMGNGNLMAEISNEKGNKKERFIMSKFN